MVTLLDYGLGNIQAFHHIYSQLNLNVDVATNTSQLELAEKIILPGVGAFDCAMNRLNNSGMREVLDDLVLNKKIPVLGVCVGLQMMANRSEEGELPGLGWINGEVKRFDNAVFSGKTHLPHMGWNDISIWGNSPLFGGLTSSRFYFLHSYYFSPYKPSQTLASTNYGGEFSSAVSNGHIYGVQFHPEKSHACGIQVLKNFAEL
jgi:imidazole glycerol-phosphate synthase subunit HisH